MHQHLHQKQSNQLDSVFLAMRIFSIKQFLIPLFVVMVNIQACTRWNEVQYQISRDMFFVRFGCGEAVSKPVEFGVTRSSVPILVRGAPEPKPLHIGNLFWRGGDKPVYITGTSPNTVLVDDIKKFLTKNGFTVTEDSAGTEATLVADITALGSDSGVWKGNPLDPGSTIGQIGYTVTLTHDNKTLWSKDFSEKVKIKAAYAYVKDMEMVMNRAYCNTLVPLENALTSEEFQEALDSIEQSI
jgi:hypothetical protein